MCEGVEVCQEYVLCFSASTSRTVVQFQALQQAATAKEDDALMKQVIIVIIYSIVTETVVVMLSHNGITLRE